MSTQQSTSQLGTGLAGLMFLLFLGLKLAGVGVVATWSWIWVFAPLWAPVATLVGLAALVYAIITTRALILKGIKRRKALKGQG